MIEQELATHGTSEWEGGRQIYTDGLTFTRLHCYAERAVSTYLYSCSRSVEKRVDFRRHALHTRSASNVRTVRNSGMRSPRYGHMKCGQSLGITLSGRSFVSSEIRSRFHVLFIPSVTIQ